MIDVYYSLLNGYGQVTLPGAITIEELVGEAEERLSARVRLAVEEEIGPVYGLAIERVLPHREPDEVMCCGHNDWVERRFATLVGLDAGSGEPLWICDRCMDLQEIDACGKELA